MREVKLPSGALLKVNSSSFATSKALYKSILKEAKGVEFTPKTDLETLYKDLFCIGFSSEEVEACLWECMKRCTYNGGKGDLKIDESTFEPEQSRQDYMTVCVEVAKENVSPFVKSLYAEYLQAISMIKSSLA